MDILDDMGASKLSAKVLVKVNYFVNGVTATYCMSTEKKKNHHANLPDVITIGYTLSRLIINVFKSLTEYENSYQHKIGNTPKKYFCPRVVYLWRPLAMKCL